MADNWQLTLSSIPCLTSISLHELYKKHLVCMVLYRAPMLYQWSGGPRPHPTPKSTEEHFNSYLATLPVYAALMRKRGPLTYTHLPTVNRTGVCTIMLHRDSHVRHSSMTHIPDEKVAIVCQTFAGKCSGGVPSATSYTGKGSLLRSSRPSDIQPSSQGQLVRLFLEGLHPNLEGLVVKLEANLRQQTCSSTSTLHTINMLQQNTTYHS